MPKPKVLFGCAAENDWHAFLWMAIMQAQSIRWYGGECADVDIRVWSAIREFPEMPKHYRDELEALGVQVFYVNPFAEDHAASNKLRMFETPGLEEYDAVVLMDADCVMLQDPSKYVHKPVLQLRQEHWMAVQHDVFRKAMTHFGVPMSLTVEGALVPGVPGLSRPRMDMPTFRTVIGEPTDPFFSSGVVIFPRHEISKTGARWYAMNREVCDNLDILGGGFPSACRDEVTLSLAIMEACMEWPPTRQAYDLFPMSMNLDLSINDSDFRFPMPDEVRSMDPIIYHYHGAFNHRTREVALPQHPLCEPARVRLKEFNQRISEGR